MVLRYFMRYLANNQQLIDKMADSYLMRRAAQLTISYMYKAKNFAAERNLVAMTPEKFRSFMAVFKTNLNQEIEGVKKTIKQTKKP